MTFPPHLSPAILSASINQIAPLLMQGAECDQRAARDAVSALLADYKPNTNEEFTLAADIVHNRLLARDNLARSAEPELPLTKVLRLRGSAVSLSREAHKAQRKLDKLQSTRAIAVADPATQPEAAPLSAAIPNRPPVNPPAPGQPLPSNPVPHQPSPPTQAELAALHAARDILSGMSPMKPGKQGGHAYAQQLRKRVLTQTIKQNAARRAADQTVKAA